MTRIPNAFKNGKAFISFVTGGDPDLDTTKKLIIEMEKSGADLYPADVGALRRIKRNNKGAPPLPRSPRRRGFCLSWRCSCLRRVTFFHQRKKVTKERRLNLRFKNPSARPARFRSLGCVPHGCKCFARGIKCGIVSASAPLPLTVQNVGVHRPFVRADVGIAPPFDRKTASNFVGGGVPDAPRSAHRFLHFTQ